MGLDLGTSGLKGVALDASGQVVARAQSGYPTTRAEPGAAEQDAHAWLAAVEVVVAGLLHTVPGDRWTGIGLSGMIPTLVVTDPSGDPVRPAITWEDARAEADATVLRSRIDADDLYRSTGQRVDGRYLLPMAMRLRRLGTLPARATRLFSAKDFLMGWLTGAFVTDPSTATGVGAYDVQTGTWNASVVAAATQDAPRHPLELPDVVASTTRQPLRASLVGRWGVPKGLPVAVGAADSVCGLLGLGLGTAGDVAYLAGSSTVVLGVADAVVFDAERRFLVTPLAMGGYALEMDLLSTGSAFAWLSQVLGLPDVAALTDLARTVPPDAPGLPVFAPYLAPGEQGALWDPTLTGTLGGLSLSHGRAELARALASGVVVESARCIEVLERACGVGTIHVAGRSAPDPMPQDLADAVGQDVVVHADTGWHSAVGAARIAAQAAQPSTSSGSGPLLRGDVATHRPDRSRKALWRQLRRQADEALRRLP